MTLIDAYRLVAVVSTVIMGFVASAAADAYTGPFRAYRFRGPSYEKVRSIVKGMAFVIWADLILILTQGACLFWSSDLKQADRLWLMPMASAMCLIVAVVAIIVRLDIKALKT